MAFVRIYADGKDVERKPLMEWLPIEYAIKQGVMTIFLKDSTMNVRLKSGEVYSVGDFNRDGPPINRMKPPHNAGDALMWLLDYNNGARYHDKASFDKFVETQCNTGQATDVIWCEGRGFGFAVSDAPGRVGIAPLAAYIDRERVVDKALAKEVLQNWKWGIFYPQPYAEKILRERFGFTTDEVAEIVRGKEFFCV